MANPIDIFPAFYDQWNQRLQALLDQLLHLSSPPHPDISGVHRKMVKNGKRRRLTNHETVTNEEARRHLIEQVLDAYQKMYEEKSKVLETDVFVALSPPWFTAIEKAMLWISWFKPSVVFPIAADSVGETMTEEQKERMEKAKVEIRRYEKDVEQEFARVQETVAAFPICEMVRRTRATTAAKSIVDGEFSESCIMVMDEFTASMRAVMADADDVRMSAVKKVMEILDLEQTIKFLTRSNQHQLELRKLGLQKEAENGRNSS